MVNNGRSLAKGSARKPLLSMAAAFFGNPPAQAGIEPSALAPRSAPIGVNVVPSLAASSGGTAANAQVLNSKVNAPP
ncbi:hypothetical protein D3C72_2513690 [compost metagenome]